MPQNKEATAFLERIKALPEGPGVSLDDALKPSVEDETELRQYFASDRGNVRLQDPCVGLVDVFDAPVDVRTTRARIVKDDDDMIAKHILPVNKEARRPEGAPSMVESLDEFKKNWAIFTEGSLSQLLDWNNVIAAGGSVLACLTPLKEENKVSKRAIRKHYHSVAYPTSDVDLFLWGLTPEQAEAKIIQIYEAVRDSVPWDVTCIRTKHTVSIHSQYPYRSVQVVLRLYHSPAEVLAGFDIDAPCCAYDGNRVWANPRAITAMMRQSNTVDMTRRSPSYEVRLAKYANRGYEIYVQDLVREKIDPTIYERSIAKMEGLARLLVFEKLMDGDARYAFLESRRKLRSRPNPLARYNNRNKRRYKGDLKEEKEIGGLEMNDYDVATLHIPYGPGWDARRIDKLVYQTDLGMNSTFNPKNKGRRLHRHPAFFGTMEECLEDCCEHCPEPIDDDEKELIAKEEDQYIIGRIKFIEENPGRQTMTGSFNPIDVGEWSEQVYVKETENFFAAVSRNDLEAVREYIKSEIDLNHRDHVGRTCLHVAIVSNAPEVACELIEAGARISARLVDGRSALHLAARFGQNAVLKKLLERSAANEAEIKKEEKDGDDAMDEDKKPALERPSSEDDWSSDDHDGKDVEMDDADDEGDGDDEGEDEDGDGSDDEKAAEEPPASNAGDLPEDDEDEPDILDINEADWDFGFTPLCYAALFSALDTVDLLLESGADVNKATSTNHNDTKQLHALDITILREDEDEACTIAERLIKAGASSSTADDQLFTIFHDIVASGRLKLAACVLKCDPNAKQVIDSPAIRHNDVIFPIVTAVQKLDYAMIALLVAYGAKLDLSEQDINKAVEAKSPKDRTNLFGWGVRSYIDQAFTPLETALSHNDDIFQLLLSLGAAFNIGIKYSKRYYTSAGDRRTIKDWVDRAIELIAEKKEKFETEIVESKESRPEGEAEIILSSWKEYLRKVRTGDKPKEEVDENAEERKKYNRAEELMKINSVEGYLVDAERLLTARSAKSWTEVFPDIETILTKTLGHKTVKDDTVTEKEEQSHYAQLSRSYYSNHITTSLNKAYDELFEAAFAGDNEKIKQLCLPPESGETETGTQLLSVNVQIAVPNDQYTKTGYTPLFAACEGRHWSTAKLIVAIAASQYTPEDDEEKVTFSTSGIKLDDDDSDEDSDDGYDSDETVEQKKEMQFVDIAKVSSGVKTNMPPKYMIHEVTFRKYSGERSTQGNLITTAVELKDVEAFTKIANLYQSLSQPIDLGEHLLHTIISADSPEILDEYIRRSGYGLDFEVAKKATAHLPPVVNDENRIYLGLNVHGKKRTDLARKNDPDAYSTASNTTPLVWRAARAGATKIIEYLATDKPLAAFRQYATACSGARAEQLRRTPDLEKVLPVWLGWNINGLGESPLIAAILGQSLPAIKTLFAKKPELMKTTLHQEIKFTGHNPLLFAVELLCEPDILDYLLAKSISPAARDTVRSWNIFHTIASNGKVEHFEHFLKKLPKDVCQALLQQQSKGRLNTPLHIAVKNGKVEMTKVILEFDNTTASYANIDGQTPLHYAVHEGYAKIAGLLLGTPLHGGLLREDAIGQTPLEVSVLKELLLRLRTSIRVSPNTLSPDQLVYSRERILIDKLEEQLPRLQEIVKVLLDQGVPTNPQKFGFELNAFIKTMESKLKDAKSQREKLPPQPASREAEDESAKRNQKESANVERTWYVLQDAVAAGPYNLQRDLIKLLDVQLSVRANLDKVSGEHKDTTNVDSDAEEDPEEVEWNSRMSYQINKYADTY
ncbi:hypothetical protein EST38_g3223 [Candolleomyces aberdarensis]|uniref:Ankyrin repeat protein n=1 Tax=Candolleomyces aberdarensis TaxID=2316362 RepID=A0A4Q2DSL3_9AGAR|nr:hypothetical protein EST38_g3223 [Candolleomyces aberdarensis]